MCHSPQVTDTGERFSLTFSPPLYCDPFVKNGKLSEPLISWRALARAALAVLELKSSLEEPSQETRDAREARAANWKNAVWLSAQQWGQGHWDCEPEYRFWQAAFT